MEKLLLTPEEAALALSIGRSKLYELLACGALRSVRIGASRRVPADALREFVGDLGAPMSGTVGTGAQPSGADDDLAAATPPGSGRPEGHRLTA